MANVNIMTSGFGKRPFIIHHLSFIIAIALVQVPSHAAPADRSLVVDAKWHHIRNAEPREWSHHPEKAEAKALVVDFEVADPGKFKLLTLRQQETQQVWGVSLNDKKIGGLIRDHNHLEHGIAIPEGLLKERGNRLVISTASEKPDDILVGELVLHSTIQTEFEGSQDAEALFKKRGYRSPCPEFNAELKLTCVDADSGKAIPCRFTIIDQSTGALVLLGAESNDQQAVRAGVVYSLVGKATVKVVAGRLYRVYAGRGFEYSLASADVTFAKGTSESVNLEIRREVPTPGLVASDTHLHTFEFDRHGDCDLSERLIGLAGEAIELPISTGHDKHIDYREEADRLGVSRWLTPVTGCEVTTQEGHFNIFPIADAGVKPVQHKGLSWAEVFKNIYATPGVRVCILNHGRDLHGKLVPLGPEAFDAEKGTFLGGRELKVNAMELINSGAHTSDPMQLVRDWFTLIRSGHRLAGIGGSDSHTVNFAIPGQARTYVECLDEDPGKLDTEAAIDSFVKQKTWVSFGLLARLDRTGEGKFVAIALGPSWSRATELRIFRNGEEVKLVKLSEPDGKKPGEKLRVVFSLDDLAAKSGDFLCAVATGPGITGAWWPGMVPYQPVSPDWKRFVMGVSPVVWVGSK
jgi:hypothetical protein